MLINKTSKEIAIANSQAETDLDKYISLTEASGLVTYSQEYLSLLARRGLIGAVKMGRNWVITRRVLFDYAEKNSAEKIGNKKGQIKTDALLRENLAPGILSARLKDLPFKVYKSARQKFAGLKNAFHQILPLKISCDNFNLKRFLAGVGIISLAVLSVYLAPVAAESYKKDLSSLAGLYEFTFVKSAASAYDSFRQTAEIYSDTFEFIKNPEIQNFKLTAEVMTDQLGLLAGDITFGYKILAEDFAKNYLDGSLKKAYGLSDTVKIFLSSKKIINEIFASPPIEKSLKHLAADFKLRPEKTFPGFVSTFQDLLVKTEILVRHKLQPYVSQLAMNLENKILFFSIEKNPEPQVAGVYEFAEDGLAFDKPDDEKLSRKKSENFLQAVGRSFKNDLFQFADFVITLAEGINTLPNKIAGLSQKAENGSLTVGGFFENTGQGLSKLAELSFIKFNQRLADFITNIRLAYHNIFNPDDNRLVRYTGSEEFATLADVRQEIEKSLSDISDGQYEYVSADGKTVYLTGPRGPVGPAGPEGIRGDQGEQGLQGETGQTGEPGEAGQGTELGTGNYYYGNTIVYGGTTVVENLSAVNSLAVGQGGLGVGGNLTVSGSTILGSDGSDTFTVNSPATFNGHLTVADDYSTTLGGSLSVASNSTLTGDLAVGSYFDVLASSGNLITEGKVAIGTSTAPTANLQITGTSGQSNNLITAASSTGNNIFTLGSTGDLNIYDYASGTANVLSFDASASKLALTRNVYNDWELVVDHEDMGWDAPAASEDFWDFEEFNGCLYSGQEGKGNPAGAIVLRTCDGTTWTQVNTSAFGNVSNTHIDSMEVFNGYLYAATGNNTGTEIWQTKNGTDWVKVNQNGFGAGGDNDNAWIMQVYKDWLVLGSSNGSTTGESSRMWATKDGTTWIKVAANGMGTGKNNIIADGGAIFKDYLYYTFWNNTDGAEMWRTNDLENWEQIGLSGFGNGINTNHLRGLITFKDALYVWVKDTSGSTTDIMRSYDGETFTTSYTLPSGVSYSTLDATYVYNNYLYFASYDFGIGTRIFRSSNGVDWEQINTTGFGDLNNRYSVLGSYKGYIYAGTRNDVNGWEIWRMQTGIIDNQTGSIIAQAGYFGDVVLQGNELYGLKSLEALHGSFAGLGVIGNASFGGQLSINIPTSTTAISALKVQATSTAALAHFNQFGTGNILTLQSSSTNVLQVLDTGQTILSAYPATTNPSLLIQPHDVSSFSQATSTMLLVNASSTFAGDLLALQVDGSVKYRIDYQGISHNYGSSEYTGDLYPASDNAYDLGLLSTTKRWRDLALYRNLYIGATSTSATGKLVKFSSSTIAFYNTDLTIDNSAASQNLLLQSSGGKVGIGTSTPYSILSVSTPSQASADTKLLTVASTTGASLFQVNADGKVGLSTSAPAYTLDVYGTARVNERLGVGTAPGSRTGINISLNQSDASGSTYGINNTVVRSAGGNNYLAGGYNNVQYTGAEAQTYIIGNMSQAKNSASAAITVNTLGGDLGWVYNEGTGTVSNMYGTYRLIRNSGAGTVNSLAGNFALLSNTSTGLITNAYGFLVDADNTNAGGEITNLYGVAIGSSGNSWSNSGTIQNAYGLYIDSSVNVGTNKWAIYSNSAADSYLAGNLGVGTTTPAVKLQVSADTEQFRISYATDPTMYSAFTVDNGGDLTVAPSGGDTNITGNLAVSGSLTVSGASFNEGATTLATTTITATGTNTVLTVRQAGTGDILNIFDGSIEVATILDGGKAGFGTSTPMAQLSASSTSNVVAVFDQRGTSDIFQLRDAGTQVFTVADGGNISATGSLTLSSDVNLARGAADRLDLATGDSFNIVSGNLQAGGTTVLDSSRVLQNITQATIDSIVLNGTTIGLSSDLDLLTLADNSLTVAGSLYAATTTLTATGINPVLTVRQDGTGDIANFKDGATTVLAVRDGGNVELATSTSAKLSVAGNIRANSLLGNVSQAWGNTFTATGTEDLLARFSLAKNDLITPTTIADLSKYSRTGTITPGVSTGFAVDAFGRANMAYDFDSANTKIDTGSDFIGTSAFSFSGWIYADSYGESSIGRIFSNGTTELYVRNNSGQQYLNIETADATTATSPTGSLLTGRWYHIVLTLGSNGNANLWLNGAQIITDDGGNNLTAGTSNVIIGNLSTSVATFDGRISDVRFFNRLLSASEAVAVYNNSQINLNSRIGIGTTTPSAVLSVSTYNSTAPTTQLLTVASSTGATLFQVLGNGTTAINAQNTSSALTVTQNSTGDIFNLYDSSIEVLTVLDGGKAGFGTSTPMGQLSASSTSNVVAVFDQRGTSDIFQLRDAGTQVFTVKDGGNIGIGDSDPDQKLEVMSAGAANTQVTVSNTNAGDYDAQIGFEVVADGTNTFTIGVDDSDSDKFKISTTALGTNDRFVITSAGLVGIGTSSPASQLQVVATTEQFRLGYNSTTYVSQTVNASGTITMMATGTTPGFDFKVRETTALQITETQVKSNVPLSVVSSGDVGISGDIVLSNGTASYITGENPLYIRTYHPAQNIDLTLQAANNGLVIIDDGLEIYGTTTIALAHTSANAFQIKDHLGVTIFNLDNKTYTASRTLNIGTNDGSTAIMTMVNVGYGSLCVDNDGTCTASTTGRISARSYTTGASDVAENYPSLEELVAGDLVMADPNNEGYVIRTTGEYNNNVIGVVSDQPGIILGSETEGYPIALVGRIPTKVSSVNGNIMPGDTLTVAPIPGYAMKLNEGNAGIIIGTALQSFGTSTATSTEGIISMFINPDYKTTFDEVTFGEITDGQIATNAAISDTKLATITSAGKIALSALPVQIALLQGDTQTFEGNYIFGADANTEDLIVFNAKIASDIKFAVDDLYNIGSASSTAANIYTRQLNSSKLVVSANNDWQNLNIDDYGLYLAASSGDAFFGDNVIVGSFGEDASVNGGDGSVNSGDGSVNGGDGLVATSGLSVVMPDYPDFVLNGGDLLVVDDLGIGGDLYVQGNIRVAGAIEYNKSGSAQMMEIEGENILSGQVVVVSATGTSQGEISTQANSTRILGVIGTSSAQVFGKAEASTSSWPVITSGLTQVKVSAENGSIRKGDLLTTGQTSGMAMLATKIGAGVLGLAMEDFSEGEGRIKVLVNLGAYYQPVAKIITVGQSGSDFKTVTKALESITDNSTTSPYLIKVAPGVYEETIALKNHVDIVGEGTELVTIVSDQSPVISGVGRSRLEGMTIKSISDQSEPVIVSFNGDDNGSDILLTSLVLEAETAEPAIGVSISGQPGVIKLTYLEFGSNFYQGISSLASGTLTIMHSDLSAVNGTALVAQNGLIKSYYNEYDGVLGDIYISELAKVQSNNDLYRQISNFGIFLDSTNRGKVNLEYIDYGWLISNAQAPNSNFQVDISAGEGYVNGVMVNTSAVNNFELNASSTNYLFMTDQGAVLNSTSTNLGTSTKAILIAQVLTDELGINNIVNERSNEIVVAKTGGQFRTISDALDSIYSNSENNRWLIKVESGIYNEQLNLKPFVDIMGVGESTIIMNVNAPVIVAELGTRLASSTATTTSYLLNEAKLQNLKLMLSGDSLGQDIVSAASSSLSISDVTFEWFGEDNVFGTAVGVHGNANVSLNRIKAFGMAYGLSSDYWSDNSATSTVNIAYSRLSAGEADIRTVCLDVETGEECNDESEIGDRKSGIDIVSSYNMLIGRGKNFEVARGTVISSAHDSYLSYSGEGSFRQNDYFRNITDSQSSIFSLQNAGLNMFNVSASGTIQINPQNTIGDSVVINSATASTTLTVINSGPGAALRVVGDLILQSATSTIPVTLSAGGGQINIGAPGDTINLNVDGVTYNFKENVRRNTLSAYLPLPAQGDRVWGDGNNSWTPPENITVLGIKAQYNCSDDATLTLALRDKNGNNLAQLAGFSCGGYKKMEEELEHYLTVDDGLYVEVVSAGEGINNVTVTIEFVYDNR